MQHASCTTVTAFFAPKSSCTLCALHVLSFTRKIVPKLCEVVSEYEKRLQEMPFVPRSSYGRQMLREDGGQNSNFLTYLFCDNGFGMQFLKDMGLLRSKAQCNNCGRDMTWSVEPSIPEGFGWRSRKKVAGVKCSESKSIKHGSWFQQRNFTFREILLISYDIVRREPASHIQ